MRRSRWGKGQIGQILNDRAGIDRKLSLCEGQGRFREQRLNRRCITKQVSALRIFWSGTQSIAYGAWFTHTASTAAADGVTDRHKGAGEDRRNGASFS